MLTLSKQQRKSPTFFEGISITAGNYLKNQMEQKVMKEDLHQLFQIQSKKQQIQIKV